MKFDGVTFGMSEMYSMLKFKITLPAYVDIHHNVEHLGDYSEKFNNPLSLFPFLRVSLNIAVHS